MHSHVKGFSLNKHPRASLFLKFALIFDGPLYVGTMKTSFSDTEPNLHFSFIVSSCTWDLNRAIIASWGRGVNFINIAKVKHIPSLLDNCCNEQVQPAHNVSGHPPYPSLKGVVLVKNSQRFQRSNID